MSRAELRRDEQTATYSLGAWYVDGARRWETIELPWEDNHADRSCIPSAYGEYVLRLRFSHTHGRALFGIYGAPLAGRRDIEVHIANRPSELLGCVGLGKLRGTLGGETAVLGSGAAFGEFMKEYGCPAWADLTSEALVAAYIADHPECGEIPLDVVAPALTPSS